MADEPFPTLPDDVRQRLRDKGIDPEKAFAAMQRDIQEGGIPDELIERIAEAPVDPRYATYPQTAWDRHRGTNQLSPREREVLQCAANGFSNREIGELIHAAEGTIQSHLKRIYGKLGARNRTHACCIALRDGVIQPPDETSR